MGREQALRLWETLPVVARAVVDEGLDLIDIFVPRVGFLSRARARGVPDLDKLEEPTVDAEFTVLEGPADPQDVGSEPDGDEKGTNS